MECVSVDEAAAGDRNVRPAFRRGAGPVARCAALLLAASLGACSALLPKSPDTIHDLTAPADVAGGGGTSAQLLIPEPSATKALDTERIAAKPTPTEYAYLPQAVWADRLPRLLQARLLETFQETGRIRAGLPGQGLLIDYQVVIDVRAFEYTAAGALVAFHVKLLNDKNGTVVATRSFSATAPVASTGNEAIVAGLDAAMDEAFREATRWVLSRI